MNIRSRFSLPSLFVGAALMVAVQSIAQHNMPGHDMSKMKNKSMGASVGVKALHMVMIKQARKDMNMKMTMSGDVDREFAKMMADHHLSGIRMAEVELKYGKSVDVRKIAWSIKTSQAKERELLLTHAAMDHTSMKKS